MYNKYKINMAAIFEIVLFYVQCDVLKATRLYAYFTYVKIMSLWYSLHVNVNDFAMVTL